MSLRFDAIRLRHVRGFGAEGMALEELAPGLNVLSAPNEFGKSTILAALKAALFLKATADSKLVRSLYGRDGSPPEIELDLTSSGEAFRLSKRFRKGRGETKLFLMPDGHEEAREAEAERKVLALIGAQKPEEGAGGLLWVEQGEALGDLAAPQKTTIAETLSREAQDITSSEDALQIQRAVAVELADLETAKTEKPTKRLLAALTDVEQAKATLREAETKLAEAQSFRSALTAKETRARTLDDPDEKARHEESLIEARRELAEIVKRAENVGHTEQKLESQRAAQRHAAEAYARFYQDQKRLKDLENSSGMAAAAEADSVAQAGTTKARMDDAQTQLLHADKKVRQLQKSLRLAEAFERWERQCAERDQAKMTLIEAQALFRQKAVAEATVARGTINLNELRALEKQVLLAEAALDAASPEVELLKGEGLTVDDEPMRPGEKRRIQGEAKLNVGDAQLAIRSTVPQDLAAKKEQAAAKLVVSLEALGLSSMDHAEQEQAARSEAAADLKRLGGEIKRLVPQDLSALETTAAANPDQPSGDKPEQSRGFLEAALIEAEAALPSLQSALDEAREAHASVEKKLIEMRAERKAAEAEEQRLGDLLGPAPDREAKLAVLAKAMTDQEAIADATERSLQQLRQEQGDRGAAERRIKRLEEAEGNRRRELASLQAEINRLEGQLTQIYQVGPEETRDAAAEQLEAAQARLDRLETRRRALKRLMAVLDDVQSQRRERLLKPLLDASLPLVTQVFGQGDIHFGSDLTPYSLSRSGREQEVTTLSKGAQEQLAILTRLGMARLFAAKNEAVPVILDDALIYADDDRTERLFDVLHRVAEEAQILVFTCHERLFDALGGHRLRPIVWPSLSQP